MEWPYSTGFISLYVIHIEHFLNQNIKNNNIIRFDLNERIVLPKESLEAVPHPRYI